MVFISTFSFVENIISRSADLNTLELYTLPQIENEKKIFQQDGAPPHYANIVREFLN